MIHILKLLGELLPFVGNAIDNVSSQDGGKGVFHSPKFIKSAVRLIIAMAIIWLVSRGQATVEDLDIIKSIK